MTINAKTLANLAVATLMIAVAVWASMRVLTPGAQRVVGVVEVGEIQ